MLCSVSKRTLADLFVFFYPRAQIDSVNLQYYWAKYLGEGGGGVNLTCYPRGQGYCSTRHVKKKPGYILVDHQVRQDFT